MLGADWAHFSIDFSIGCDGITRIALDHPSSLDTGIGWFEGAGGLRAFFQLLAQTQQLSTVTYGIFQGAGAAFRIRAITRKIAKTRGVFAHALVGH